MAWVACVGYPSSAKNREHQQSKFEYGGQPLLRIPSLLEGQDAQGSNCYVQ